MFSFRRKPIHPEAGKGDQVDAIAPVSVNFVSTLPSPAGVALSRIVG
jgi:hypothetical protein